MRIPLCIIHRIFYILLITITALFVLLPTSPLNMPLTYRDSGVYLYTGWRILNGEVPYLDIMNDKPPLIYYINALGLSFSNGSRWGVWLLELISLCLAVYICFILMKSAFGTIPAIFSVYLFVFSLINTLQGGNLTTEYTLPLQFGCFWLAYQAEERGFYSWRGYLIGVLSCIAFLSKQNMCGAGIAIVLYIIISRIIYNRRKRLLPDLLPILFGGLTVFVIVISFFISRSAFRQFWDFIFLHNLSRVPAGHMRWIKASINGIKYLRATGLTHLALIGWSAGLIWVFFNKINPERRIAPLLFIGLINLPIELILSGVTLHSFPHHYMALLPIFTILAGFTFWMLINVLSRLRFSKTAIYLFTIITLIAFSSTIAGGYIYLVKNYRQVRGSEVISYIKNSTSEDDFILIWGGQPEINFFAKRRCPTRFIYQYLLYYPGYANDEMIEEFLGDIVRNKPRLIIDSIGRGIYESNFEIESPQIDKYFEFIKSNYEVKESVDSWPVYVYIGN